MEPSHKVDCPLIALVSHRNCLGNFERTLHCSVEKTGRTRARVIPEFPGLAELRVLRKRLYQGVATLVMPLVGGGRAVFPGFASIPKCVRRFAANGFLGVMRKLAMRFVSCAFRVPQWFAVGLDLRFGRLEIRKIPGESILERFDRRGVKRIGGLCCCLECLAVSTNLGQQGVAY
jgi:hypothetical protein